LFLQKKTKRNAQEALHVCEVGENYRLQGIQLSESGMRNCRSQITECGLKSSKPRMMAAILSI
jgi:hypothetical protein